MIVTIMAINTATSSYIITKLEEMAYGSNFNFNKTYDAMRTAIFEQVIIVIISFILLVFRSNQFVKKSKMA